MKQTLLLLCFLFGASSAFSQTLPPPPPANVKAEQVGLSNQVKVSWSLVNNGTYPHNGYKVYYKQEGATVTDSVSVVRTADNTTLSGLATNKKYNVQVRAFRNDTIPPPAKTVYSAYSPVVQVTVAALVAPAFRIEPSGTAHNKILIEITDTNEFESGFEVELSENEFTKKVLIAKSGSNLLETIGGLKPKTQYSVRVRAVKDGVPGPYSAVRTVTTLIDVPPAAVVTSGGNCPNEVEIKWNIPTRFDEVRKVLIMRSTDKETFVEVGNVDPNMSPFIDHSANPGIRYHYVVHTENISGKTNSNLVSVDVPAYTPPSLPINITSLANSKTTNSLTVTWNRGPEDLVCRTNLLGQNEVAIKVNGGEMKILATLPAWENMYKIDGLNPKDIVEILLRPHSDRGIIGGWISIKDTTFGPSVRPSNFIGVLFRDKIGRRALTLEWKDNSDDEDYFEIHKSTDGVNFKQHAILFMNYTKLIDTDLEEGMSYFYKIRSANWAGESDFTDPIGPFYVGYSETPNAPYGLNLKRNGNGIDISWVDDSIKEKSYIVEKSNDNGATYAVIATLDKDVIAYRDENIAEGRTYFYRVKATNTVGSSAYSKEAKITLATGAAGFALTVFPNPIAESLNLKVDGESAEGSYDIKIYDQNNRLVLDRTIELDLNGSANISANSLSHGTYNMTVTKGNDTVSKKLIKL
jgi:hypothetical protein